MKSSAVGVGVVLRGPKSPWRGVRFVGERRIFSDGFSFSAERRGIEALMAMWVMFIAIAIVSYNSRCCSFVVFEKSFCHSGALKT